MRGRIVDLTMGMNRKQRVTLELDADFRAGYEALNGRELDIELKPHREKRSRNANAYFHTLVNKIAAETGESDEIVKCRLVVEYGALQRGRDGLVVGFKVPEEADVSMIYPYVRRFDTRIENGRRFACYLAYKQTHDMDTKEMARLIDGAVSEAKELGIETDTPETIERYKSYWRSQQ